MNKFICLLLAAAIMLSLAACGGNDQIPDNQTISTEAQTIRTDPDAAEAEIRFALSLLVDRNYIAEEIAGGGQMPAASFVARGVTDGDGSLFSENAGHSQAYSGYYDTAKDGYEDNFARAYAILTRYYDVDEKGMLTNFPALTFLYGTGQVNEAIGAFLQTVFATVGIQLELEEQPWDVFQDNLREGRFMLACSGWVAEDDDPLPFLRMWTSDSGENIAGFGKGSHASAAVYDLDLTGYGYDIRVEDGTWAQTYDVLIDTIDSCSPRKTRYALAHLAEDLLMSTGAVMPLYFEADSASEDVLPGETGEAEQGDFEVSLPAGQFGTVFVCWNICEPLLPQA